MYKREGKEKCDLPIGRVFNYHITLSTLPILIKCSLNALAIVVLNS